MPRLRLSSAASWRWLSQHPGPSCPREARARGKAVELGVPRSATRPLPRMRCGLCLPSVRPCVHLRGGRAACHWCSDEGTGLRTVRPLTPVGETTGTGRDR